MSHPASASRPPRPSGPLARTATFVLVALGAAGAQGCDVDWSGVQFRIEQPAAGAGAADTAGAGDRSPIPPLPSGPLLYYVRAEGDGSAVAAPAARVGPDGRLAALALPDSAPAAWRERFDSLFYGPGRELALHVGSRRAGSLVLTGRATPDASCPPVAVGRVFVAPGQPAPARSIALPAGTWEAEPGPAASPEPDARARQSAPVLAERLLRERGVPRPFLAELADLAAVPFPGSGRPGMAASYLIGDTLAPTPPADSAASLFFLARHDSAQGYRPLWVRVHRYGPEGGKRAYAHVASADGPTGRVHFLRRYDDRSVRLAALWPDSAGDPTGSVWVGSERCSPLRLADGAAAGGG